MSNNALRSLFVVSIILVSFGSGIWIGKNIEKKNTALQERLFDEERTEWQNKVNLANTACDKVIQDIRENHGK